MPEVFVGWPGHRAGVRVAKRQEAWASAGRAGGSLDAGLERLVRQRAGGLCLILSQRPSVHRYTERYAWQARRGMLGWKAKGKLYYGHPFT